MKSRVLITVIAALSCSTALADEGNTHCFTGYAYHLDSDQYAYSEHHEQTLVNDRATQWKVTYRGPDGKVLANKNLDFSENDFVPVFRMEMPASGYVEGIRHDDGQWTMIRRKAAGKSLETEAFDMRSKLAADSGFHPYVVAHFDQLMAGDKVKFRFAAAGRQSVIKMKAERVEDSSFEGKPTVRFRTELDMFLVSMLIDPLLLDYDPQTRALKEYRGIGNMHDDDAEPYPVRVSYYSEKPADAASVTTACGGN